MEEFQKVMFCASLQICPQCPSNKAGNLNFIFRKKNRYMYEIPQWIKHGGTTSRLRRRGSQNNILKQSNQHHRMERLFQLDGSAS